MSPPAPEANRLQPLRIDPTLEPMRQRALQMCCVQRNAQADALSRIPQEHRDRFSTASSATMTTLLTLSEALLQSGADDDANYVFDLVAVVAQFEFPLQITHVLWGLEVVIHTLRENDERCWQEYISRLTGLYNYLASLLRDLQPLVDAVHDNSAHGNRPDGSHGGDSQAAGMA